MSDKTQIPLRDINGEVVKYAKISDIDYDKVIKEKWHISGEYARKTTNNFNICMHEFILGKAPKGFIIDHIDHDGCNNTRENLRFATIPQNNQNTPKPDGLSSKYKGVCWNKDSEKWQCNCCNTYLGSFDNEEEAGKKYDTFVLLKLGPHSYTNNLVKYDDVKDIDIETLLCKRPVKIAELPECIHKKGNSFDVQIKYGKLKFRKVLPTLKEAIKQLESFKKEINDFKEKEEQERINQPIIRNEKGQAVIYAKNKNGDIVGAAIVSDDKWHECMKHKWSLNDKGYFQATISKDNKMKLNQFIMNSKEGDMVEIINKNKNDYRTENLRFSNRAMINHSKIKNENATSIYKGVSLEPNTGKWRAEISKDGKSFYIGLFKEENDAAVAYLDKEKELYGPKKKVVYKNEEICEEQDEEIDLKKKKIIKKQEVIIEEQNEEEEVIVLKKKKIVHKKPQM